MSEIRYFRRRKYRDSASRWMGRNRTRIGINHGEDLTGIVLGLARRRARNGYVVVV